LFEGDAVKRGAVKFLNLQYGDCTAEMALAHQRGWPVFEDKSVDPLKDLEGFAAQVAACDRVISVSNTTVHVAGALNVPCDVLVPAGKAAPHHWFHREEKSPWYPSLTLHWQPKLGDWQSVIKRLS
jgi:ADP-heptose:LPS heptosyltransferase